MKQILKLDGFNTFMFQTTNGKKVIRIDLACDIPKKENIEKFLIFFNMISNTLTDEKERVQDNLIMTGIIIHSFMGKMMLDAFLRIYTPIRPLIIVKDENNFINLESSN